MIASYILSRTLVPTLANYLLKPHTAHEHGEKPRDAQSAGAVPARLRGALRAGPRGLSRAAGAGARRAARSFITLLPGLRAGLVRAGAVPRPQLLPVGRRRPDHAARARADRHADRGDGRRSSPTIEEAIREIIPPDELATIVDNIGLPVSGINLTYSNTGAIGPQDGDILITLSRGPRPDRRLRDASCASSCRERFPGVDLLLPAGRHRQPDPELRPAGADRRAGRRPRPRRRTASYADKLLAQHPQHSRHRRRAHPAGAQRAGARTSMSTARAPQQVGLTERDVDQHAGGHPRRQQPDRADLLAESAPTASPTPSSLQTPQYRLDSLSALSQPADHRRRRRRSLQVLGGLADITPRRRQRRWSSHYNTAAA